MGIENLMEQHENSPIFYINLDRAPARRAFMEKQFAALNLGNPTRFAALDVKNPATLQNANYKPGGWRARWSLTPTEIANFESHRALWQHIVDEDMKSAVIMEDDIFLSKTLKAGLYETAKRTEAFDVIRLDGNKGLYRFGPDLSVGAVHMRTILETVPSSACYMVSLAGAAKLLQYSAVYCDHTDDFIFSQHTDVKTHQIWPAIALQGMFSKSTDPDASDILVSERTSVKSESTAPNKGPLLYRISKELRRVYLRMARKLFKDRALLKRGGHIGYPPLADDLPPYR